MCCTCLRWYAWKSSLTVTRVPYMANQPVLRAFAQRETLPESICSAIVQETYDAERNIPGLLIDSGYAYMPFIF